MNTAEPFFTRFAMLLRKKNVWDPNKHSEKKKKKNILAQE
jgi:hypothetical protein